MINENILSLLKSEDEEMLRLGAFMLAENYNFDEIRKITTNEFYDNTYALLDGPHGRDSWVEYAYSKPGTFIFKPSFHALVLARSIDDLYPGWQDTRRKLIENDLITYLDGENKGDDM